MDLPFVWNSEKQNWDTEFRPKFSAGDVQLLAGCSDEEISADYYIPQQESGETRHEFKNYAVGI